MTRPLATSVMQLSEYSTNDRIVVYLDMPKYINVLKQPHS